MNRRAVLARLGGIAATGSAGCVANDDGAGDGNGTTGGTETGDGTATEHGTSTNGNHTRSENGTREETATPTTEPGDGGSTSSGGEGSFSDASLTAVDSGCGQRTDEAEVTFERDDAEVVVTGTIWGSDLCKVPELVDAAYDTRAGELTITVGTTIPDSDGTPACAQCISELDYRVNAAFDGELPGSVVVVHEHGDGGKTVTTAQS